MTDPTPLLKVRGLVKRYPGWRGRPGQVALDDVGLDLMAGETLGIVGESGSGKSTLARVLMRLIDADRGQAEFGDIDMLRPSSQEAKRLTRAVQIVFQDPNSSMNPRRTVRQALSEATRVAGTGRTDTEGRLAALLDGVGLSREKLDAFPHQLSGGQRQRVAIARAMAVSPQVIIADECVSALDVSVQSSVLNLLLDLQKEFGIAYIFISHDLAVVRHMSDRVMVMQAGRVVETGPCADVLARPRHEYTRELLSSLPGQNNA